MTIYLAADHAGFALKEKLKQFLVSERYQIKDFGAFSFSENDDYPDFMRLAASAVANNAEDRALIFGGSGEGEAMTANRFKGVRAAVYYGGTLDVVKLSREHNNANILSFGARFVGESDAIAAAKLWLETPFPGEERHVRRIAKIDR